MQRSRSAIVLEVITVAAVVALAADTPALRGRGLVSFWRKKTS